MRSLLSLALAVTVVLGAVPIATAQCLCPFQGDMSDDGNVDLIDDGYIIEHLFFGRGPNLQDPTCPTSRDDLNADGFIDIIDLEILYDILFYDGSHVDPCACGFPCARVAGSGAGSVVVESKTVPAGLPNTIGIYLTNTATLEGVVIPLVIRAIDTYPTALSFALRADGRLNTEFAAQLKISGAFDLMDGDCAGAAGTGFSVPVVTGNHPLAAVTLPSVSSPDAFQCNMCGIFFETTFLPPGSDVIPSLEITFTAPAAPGTFEVDTTCTGPANHLSFQEQITHGEIIPSFTKGTITVIPCDCPFQGDLNADNFPDALDLGALIDVLFFGGSDVQDPWCPTTRADFNDDGFADALDFNALINQLFFNGGDPCDPCNPVQGTCAP